jgi:hypothetical protein
VIGESALSWLLEPDNPSARFLALIHILDRPTGDPEAAAARTAIPGWGPAKAILDAQWPEGYWVGPGVGYSPRHKATIWQVIFLAALGTPRIEAIDRACAYVLDHSRLPDGRFSAYKTARGAVACLNGNLLQAFSQLGYEDPRLEKSLEALTEMILRDRFCCRFNAVSPIPSRMADGLPCAWGAVKALGAFAEVTQPQRSPAMQKAIEIGIEFLLGGDLLHGIYATAIEPSPLWLRFGFPLGYTSDVLEAMHVLKRLGVEHDGQLALAAEIVRGKQDDAGRWRLEHTPENTWASFGQVGQPNKWVTLRALGALKGLGRGPKRDNR